MPGLWWYCWILRHSVRESRGGGLRMGARHLRLWVFGNGIILAPIVGGGGGSNESPLYCGLFLNSNLNTLVVVGFVCSHIITQIKQHALQ